jgi:hypothetical protein
VPLSRTDIQKVFNQVSTNHKALEFEHFYKGILRLGVEINNEKIKKLRKRLRLLPSDGTEKPKTKKKPAKKSTKEGSESESGEGDDSESGEGSEGNIKYMILYRRGR